MDIRRGDLNPGEILHVYILQINKMPKLLNGSLPDIPKVKVSLNVLEEEEEIIKLKEEEEEEEDNNKKKKKKKKKKRKKKKKKKKMVDEEEEEEEEDGFSFPLTNESRKRKRTDMMMMESTTTRRNMSSDENQSPFSGSPFNNNEEIQKNNNSNKSSSSSSSSLLPPRKKRRGSSIDYIRDGTALKRQGDGMKKINKSEAVKFWCRSGLHFMIAAHQKENIEGEKKESAILYKQTGDMFKVTARENESITNIIPSRRTRRRRKQKQEKQKKKNNSSTSSSLLSEICFLGMAACYIQCFRLRKMDVKNTGKEIHSILHKHSKKKNKEKKKQKEIEEEIEEEEEDNLELKKEDVKKTMFFLETSNLLVSAFTVLDKAYALSPVHKDMLSFKIDDVITLMEELINDKIINFNPPPNRKKRRKRKRKQKK